jgi:hypothetical protein
MNDRAISETGRRAEVEVEGLKCRQARRGSNSIKRRARLMLKDRNRSRRIDAPTRSARQLAKAKKKKKKKK